jgi:hypothetical protein
MYHVDALNNEPTGLAPSLELDKSLLIDHMYASIVATLAKVSWDTASLAAAAGYGPYHPSGDGITEDGCACDGSDHAWGVATFGARM